MSKSIFDDLASTDIAEVDTKFPNLAPGVYEFRVESATRELGGDEGGKDYMKFSCKLVSDGALDTSGETLSPGYPMVHMINCMYTDGIANGKDGKGGKSEEEFQKGVLIDVAKFIDAVMEKDSNGRRPSFDPDLTSYVGQTFFAEVKMGKARTGKDGTEYEARPEFKKFLPKEETAELPKAD